MIKISSSADRAFAAAVARLSYTIPLRTELIACVREALGPQPTQRGAATGKGTRAGTGSGSR